MIARPYDVPEQQIDPPSGYANGRLVLSPWVMASILNDAAKLVDAGWCQGSAQRYNGAETAYCLTESIREAVKEHGGDELDGNEILDIVEDYLNSDEPQHAPVEAHEWNDMPGRYAEQVSGLQREIARGLVMGR